MASSFTTTCYSSPTTLQVQVPIFSANPSPQSRVISIQAKRRSSSFLPLTSTNSTRVSKSRPLTVLCVHDSKASAVTKSSWDESVINSELPVLVEFYASWCGPCRMVHRVIDEIAVEYSGRMKCFILNTDNDLQIAEDYEIKAVPVVLLFKNGKQQDCVVGTMPKEFYIAAIEKVLSL